jgi:hypothetical protein
MSDHDSCMHDLYECNDEGFARPNTSCVIYDMRDAIVAAAVDVDKARRSVYHLQEEEDAYYAVAVARGRYLALMNVATSPSAMGPEEVTELNAWATLVYDALAAAHDAGFPADAVVGLVVKWLADHHPTDDPRFERSVEVEA